MNNEKAIMLIDMDSFFASCHTSIDASLKGIPIAVATPNLRAVVTTASYEARAFGVKAGMPLFQVKKICPDIKIIDPNFNLYVDKSNKIFTFIRDNFSKKIEVISIDEAYLDVTNEYKTFGSVKKMADQIRKSVEKTFNQTCSIGISTNKFLAKMGSNLNKPNGTFVFTNNLVPKVLWPMEVEKMYGVGVVTKTILNEHGYFLVSDIALGDENNFVELFGKRGFVMYANANGFGSDELTLNVDESKSVSNEMSLGHSTRNIKEIEEYLFELTKNVCLRLQKNVQKGKTVSIYIRYEHNYNYDGFDKHKHHQRSTHQHTLAKVTNKVEDIYSIAKELFYELWDDNSIILLGLRVSNLGSFIKEFEQISFNGDFNVPTKQDNLNKFIIDINRYSGKNIIMNGVEYERKFVRETLKNNSGISKIDADRVNEKNILEKWKKIGRGDD